MPPILVVSLSLVALSAEPANGSAPMPPGLVAVEAEDTSPRTGGELREAVREALRRWARPTNEEAQQAAREFISLFIELERDDELARSQSEYLKTKVRSRLLDLRDQIAYQLAVERRLRRERGRQVRDAEGKGDSLVDGSEDAAELAGTPARGGGALRTDDYGQALVDLIQTTIRPETWDVNGGTGSIYYWYPGRALVIRQMGEVHEEVGGVLGQLRRLQN